MYSTCALRIKELLWLLYSALRKYRNDYMQIDRDSKKVMCVGVQLQQESSCTFVLWSLQLQKVESSALFPKFYLVLCP